MVVFEIAGETWPVDDRTAELLAVAFRLDAVAEPDAPIAAARGQLADALEEALVGTSATPIHVGEDAAEALLRELNRTLRDPDAIDPAYALYLQVRRFLGRLTS